MQSRYLITLTAFAALLLAGGCVTTSKQTMTPNFGESVRNNIAVQTTDPMAGEEEMPANTLDGQKAERGLERYRSEEAEAETDRLVEDIVQ